MNQLHFKNRFDHVSNRTCNPPSVAAIRDRGLIGRATSPTEPSSVDAIQDRVPTQDLRPLFSILRVVMTYDITLKKACRVPLRLSRSARRGHPPLYILLIFKCHRLSQRQKPLQQGGSSVTLDFPLLSFVTPKVEQASRLFSYLLFVLFPITNSQ